MAIGGGPTIDRYSELGRGVACLLGLPDNLWYAGLLIMALLLLFIAYISYAEKKPIWSFYLSVLIVAPTALILITNPAYFHFRYVIVCFPFYYLMISFILAKAWRTNKKAFHYSIVLIISLYIAGQSLRLLPLFQYGRGSYQKIMHAMVDATATRVVTVGSDHDFRNKMVLSFYARFLQGGKTLQYVDQRFWSTVQPEWLIVHSLDESAVPEPWIAVADDRKYLLAKAERFSGNSGFSWFLYHDENR